MLSICIPAYIHSEFTLGAAKSILAGNEDFELIVVNDFYRLPAKSPEKHAALELLDLLASDPRAKSFSNSHAIPIYANWNKTIEHAERPFIKMLGADDMVGPEDIKRILEILGTYKDATAHGHLARIINSQGQLIRYQAPYIINSTTPIRLTGRPALKLKLAQVARLKEPACNIFLKSAWRAIGGYPENVRFRSDVTFNIRLLQHGTCYFWNEYLADLRRHEGSDGRTLPAEMAACELSDLIDELYEAIGSDLTDADRRNGEAWHLYRLIELTAQRYRKKPMMALQFILKNRRPHAITFKNVADTLSILKRRLKTGDVQQTLKRDPTREY